MQKFLLGFGVEESLTEGVVPHGRPRTPVHQSSKNPFKKAAAFIGQNAEQIDANEIQQQLASGDHPVLQADEVAHLAFKVGRDTVVLTQCRMLKIDVQGMTGKKVEYRIGVENQPKVGIANTPLSGNPDL
eukprot:5625382-Amphidinium_carterae.1